MSPTTILTTNSVQLTNSVRLGVFDGKQASVKKLVASQRKMSLKEQHQYFFKSESMTNKLQALDLGRNYLTWERNVRSEGMSMSHHGENQKVELGTNGDHGSTITGQAPQTIHTARVVW